MWDKAAGPPLRDSDHETVTLAREEGRTRYKAIQSTYIFVASNESARHSSVCSFSTGVEGDYVGKVWD